MRCKAGGRDDQPPAFFLPELSSEEGMYLMQVKRERR